MLARNLAEEEYEEEYQQPQPQAPQRPATTTQQVQAYAQNRVARRTAQQDSSLRSKLQGRIAIMLLIGTIMTGILIYMNSMVAAKGFEIVQVRSQAVKLEAENAQLEITNAHLKSPQRIKEIATSKLGMGIADKVYFAEGR